MTTNHEVTEHYNHGGLLSAIEVGLAKLGLTPETATIHDLAPVDEFHIGGRAASTHLLDQLSIRADMRILDIGCGLGGGARFTAATYDAHVTGIDLTSEYVDVGQTLCRWVGLADRVNLQQGSALSMPIAGGVFDGAYMMHVGMNIEAKDQLFAEIYRVLAPGAHIGIYDIMRIGSDDPTYHVPWAASPSTSWLVDPSGYKRALESAGLSIVAENNRCDFALEFFRKTRDANKANNGPPPLGLHTLMQHNAAERVGNMVASLSAGDIAPVEIVAVKP